MTTGCGVIEGAAGWITVRLLRSLASAADDDKVPNRGRTHVYHFHRRPKGFECGELRICDDLLRNGKLARAETCRAIEPRHNRRFPVNGWVNPA